MNRRQQVTALRKTDATMTLRAIGDIVGCTRERVRQILKTAGLPTSTQLSHVCPCGNTPRRPTLYGFNSIYCSEACKEKANKDRIAATHVIPTCEWCGGPTPPRERSNVKFQIVERNYQHTWCSKICQGQWLGKNHGTPLGFRKTHCKYGHTLDDARVYTKKDGYINRHCLTCALARQARRRHDSRN